jgi:hypothetical protein
MSDYFKPLDIVKGPNGYIGVVTETNGTEAAVDWFAGTGEGWVYSAWWNHKDNPQCGTGKSMDGLIVIDSMLRILLNSMAHPFGSNGNQYERMMGIEAEDGGDDL